MTAPSYQNYLYRPARTEDTESMTELFNICSLKDIGAAQFLMEDNRSWWQSPGFNRPFEEEFTRWMHRIDNDPDFDPSLWFVTVAGKRIVGMALCSPKIIEDPDMGWNRHARRPVALALLHHSFGEFYRRGKRRLRLGVDADSLIKSVKIRSICVNLCPQDARLSSDPNSYLLFTK